MVSPRKNWIISDIARSAQTNIENLNIKLQEKVIIRFESLEKDPFLGDVKKVKREEKYL